MGLIDRAILLLSLILSAHAQASDSENLEFLKNLSPTTTNICTFSDLTKDCKIFDILPTKITLPDGTSFTNPTKAPDLPEDPYASVALTGCPPIPNESADAYLDRQSKLVEQLASEKNLSTKMALCLQNSFSDLSDVVLDKNGNFVIPQLSPEQVKATSEQTIALPWPARDNKAKMTQVPITDVLSMLNKLAPKTRQLMDACLKVDRDRYAAKEKTSQKRQSDMEQLVTEAKQALIEKLQGVPPSSSVNPDVQHLIDKLNSIKLADISRPDSNCKKAPFDAHYDPDNNHFSICSGFLNYPPSQLIGIIGHELFHAIDPCLSTAGVWKVPSASLIQACIAKPSPAMTDMDLGLLSDLKNRKNFAYDPSMEFSEKFSKEGLRLHLWEPVIPGVSVENYPMREALKCLQTQAPLANVTDQDLQETAWEYVAENHLTPKDQPKVFAALQKNPSCTGSIKQASQNQEAMADMGGAIAQGHYLKSHPPKSDLERITAVSAFLGMACRENSSYLHQKSADESPVSIYRDIQNLADKKQDHHPDDALRTEKIYMSQPEIAAAMGCAPQSAQSCFKKIDDIPYHSSPASKDGNRGQE